MCLLVCEREKECVFTFVVVLFSFIYLYELVIYDCSYSVLAMVPNKTFELELELVNRGPYTRRRLSVS